MTSTTRSFRCSVEEGSVMTVFMPTSLDSTSHKRLKFLARKEGKDGSLSVISSSHPQNREVPVEGTKFVPANADYAVGIIDEATNQIHLFQADVFAVQTLVQTIPQTRSDFQGSFNNSNDPSAGAELSYAEKRSQLINTYAPVKRQRQLRAAVNSVVSDERIEGLQETMDSIKTLKEEDSKDVPSTGIIGQMKELLPPFDLSATVPEKIFNFNSVLPVDQLFDDSKDDTSDMTTTLGVVYKWVSEGNYSGYKKDEDNKWMEDIYKLKSVSQLIRLYSTHKQDRKKIYAKQLTILVCMILLYKLRRTQFWSASEIFANEQLAELFGTLYAGNQKVGGALGREGSSKLLAHICLMVLKLSPFWEFDYADLKNDLILLPKDLFPVMSFCGITFKATGSGSMIGKLKAPLTIQSPQDQAKRRTKKN